MSINDSRYDDEESYFTIESFIQVTLNEELVIAFALDDTSYTWDVENELMNKELS